MSFKRRPSPKDEKEFIDGADEPVEERPKQRKKPPQKKEHYPWEGSDPKATAKNIFNLRLNDYEMAMLRYLSEQEEDLSMQKIAKRILIPELKQRLGLK